MHRPRFHALAAALALALVFLVAIPQAFAQSISFTDAGGRTIKLAAKARRVVSLSPALTEILYAAGGGQVLVGNTSYCNYPPEAVSKPKVGGFSGSTVSLESVIALAPDLVLGEDSMHGELAARLAKSGIQAVLFRLDDFNDIYAALTRLGEIAGDKAIAARTVESMKSRLAALAANAAKVPRAERPAVFWEVWDDPVMSAGPGTFTSMIIEAAGGRNIFADAKQDWPIVSFEEILSRNPDVIMSAGSHGEKLTFESLSRRPGWASLAAIKARRLFLFDEDMSSRPGPRLVDAAEKMAAALAGIKAGR